MDVLKTLEAITETRDQHILFKTSTSVGWTTQLVIFFWEDLFTTNKARFIGEVERFLSNNSFKKEDFWACWLCA